MKPMLRPIAAEHRATIEAHLMIDHPKRHLAAFARAGAGCITVHVEACRNLHRTLTLIRSLDARAGVALNPATPIVMLQEILPDIDLVLIMSVDPGASGQQFIPGSLAKIARLRRVLDRRGLNQVAIEVDGGVHTDTIAGIARAGATLVVAGSGVFTGPRSVAENLAALRAVADNPPASSIGRQARPSPASSP
jgi:ribulose-phosphate 3-epimerase